MEGGSMQGFAPTTPAAKQTVPRHCYIGSGIEASKNEGIGGEIDLNKPPSDLDLSNLADLFGEELLDTIRGTEVDTPTSVEAAADQTATSSVTEQIDGSILLNKEKHESVIFTSTGTYSSLNSGGKSISREEVYSTKRKNLYVELIQTEAKKPKKRHAWPKIYDRFAKKFSKTKTPEKKILTPKGRTPKKVRNEKKVVKSRNGEVQNGDKICEVPQTCKRALSFTDSCGKSEINNDDPYERMGKELTEVAESKECPESVKFIVYQRKLKKNDCQRNSIKIGPNFPKMCKRSRTVKYKARKISFLLIKVRKSRELKKKACYGFLSATKMHHQATARDACLRSLLPKINEKKKRSNRPILKRFPGLQNRYPTMAGREDGFSFKGLSLNQKEDGGNEGWKASFETTKSLDTRSIDQKEDGGNEGWNASFETTKSLDTRSIDHTWHSGGFDLDGDMKLNRGEGDVERNLVPSDQNALVSLKHKGDNAIVLVKPKKTKSKKLEKPEVDIDPETRRVWNLQLVNQDYKVEDEGDAETEKHWEQEKIKFSRQVDTFCSMMHAILGDDRCAPWKASVIDSVIGVFLTQNATDNLSSSAFLRLAAKFPVKPTTCDQKSIEFEKTTCNPTTVENDVGSSSGCSSKNARLSSDENLVDSPILDKTEILEQEVSNTLRNSIDTNALSNNSHVHRECSSNDELELTLGPCCIAEHPASPQTKSPEKKKKAVKKQVDPINWDDLRKMYGGNTSKATNNITDCADWDAVRRAPIDEVAEAIKERGQHYVLAKRIQEFLVRVLKDHGSSDLEWLRNVPQDKAKEYLLSIDGLGLKSVECLRLLSLNHHAFPVDTNVGRVAVRLGWVPLQPMPDSLQLHLLKQYPMLDNIQVYLWPRLRHLDGPKLFSLHYHMITFGKVFCTKRKPNCHACPLKGDCRHYASLEASARSALPRPEGPRAHEKHEGNNTTLIPVAATSTFAHAVTTPFLLEAGYQTKITEPIVELAPDSDDEENFVNGEYLDTDIEDLACNPHGPDEADFYLKLSNGNGNTEMLKALVPHYGPLSAPKWKSIERLRTIVQAYELTDKILDGLIYEYPILQALQLEKRDSKDLSPYLLAPWFSGESGSNDQNQEYTVPASILIPLRTATRGAFPLSGTYFQINEVFADYETSIKPLNMPRDLFCRLKSKRDVFCGAAVSAVFKGLSLEKIVDCFGKGSLCIRAFNRKTREPSTLPDIFHISTTHKGRKSTTPPKKAAQGSN